MVWIFVRREFVTLLPKPARVSPPSGSLPSQEIAAPPHSALVTEFSSRCLFESRRNPLTTHADFGVRCSALGVCCIISDEDRHERVANPLTSTITCLLSRRRLTTAES